MGPRTPDPSGRTAPSSAPPRSPRGRLWPINGSLLGTVSSLRGKPPLHLSHDFQKPEWRHGLPLTHSKHPHWSKIERPTRGVPPNKPQVRPLSFARVHRTLGRQTRDGIRTIRAVSRPAGPLREESLLVERITYLTGAEGGRLPKDRGPQWPPGKIDSEAMATSLPRDPSTLRGFGSQRLPL